MTASFSYRRTYRLGRRHSIEFVLDAGAGRLDCLWMPAIPPARIGRRLLPAYRRARADFIAGLDVNVLVVDL